MHARFEVVHRQQQFSIHRDYQFVYRDLHACVTVAAVKLAEINGQLSLCQHVQEKSFFVNQTGKNFVADCIRHENVVSYPKWQLAEILEVT
jgi:hypothetical protein